MVAPFFGCTFGGWLYDMFLYTGASPINTPWAGLERVFRPTPEKWSSYAMERAGGKDEGKDV
jgi:aquaglyceroporin related protein, other eukaryote